MGQLASNKAMWRAVSGGLCQQRPSRRAAGVSATPTRLRQYTGSGVRVKEGTCQIIELRPDFSDLWRLKDVVDILEEGAVIPSENALHLHRRAPAYVRTRSLLGSHCAAITECTPYWCQCDVSCCRNDTPVQPVGRNGHHEQIRRSTSWYH
jgi:hypothetical protein